MWTPLHSILHTRLSRIAPQAREKLCSLKGTGSSPEQRLLMEKARTAVAAAMANNLAHQINNPLQGLMQTVFLVSRGGAETGVYAQQAMGDLARLSDLVQRLLSFPDNESTIPGRR